jgi:hypothetical protein
MRDSDQLIDNVRNKRSQPDRVTAFDNPFRQWQLQCNQETEEGQTMTKSNLATDDQTPATAPTHIMYTPVWESGGGKFRKWLAVGSAWLDERNEMFGRDRSAARQRRGNRNRLFPICARWTKSAGAADGHQRGISRTGGNGSVVNFAAAGE